MSDILDAMQMLVIIVVVFYATIGLYHTNGWFKKSHKPVRYRDNDNSLWVDM